MAADARQARRGGEQALADGGDAYAERLGELGDAPQRQAMRQAQRLAMWPSSTGGGLNGRGGQSSGRGGRARRGAAHGS